MRLRHLWTDQSASILSTLCPTGELSVLAYRSAGEGTAARERCIVPELLSPASERHAVEGLTGETTLGLIGNLSHLDEVMRFLALFDLSISSNHCVVHRLS